MESMQRLANAINRFVWRTEPSYPFSQRPVTHITTEPSIEIRPFKRAHIERMKSLTEGPMKEALSRHFKGVEFKVVKADVFGMNNELVAVPEEFPDGLPTHISVSRLPCYIEFNFKRSHRGITRRDVRKYVGFVREILGEE